MANLVETSIWEPGIYQWEDSDPLDGGPEGIDNVPTRQLANRTRWLIDSMIRNVGGVPSFQAGTLAARPAFGTPGRLYLVTDATPLPRLDRDTGTAWVQGVAGAQYSSNANGGFVRWENGVQLCWHRIAGFGALESSLNTVVWTFPAAFTATPITPVAGAGNFSGTPVLMTARDGTATGVTVDAYLPVSRPNYASAELLAIGRWK